MFIPFLARFCPTFPFISKKFFGGKNVFYICRKQIKQVNMAKQAELKTKVNNASVEGFLNSVEDEKKRKDSFEILKLMKQVTKETPKMWGSSIIGFGSYHYKGASGREGDWMLTGFSPRKQNLTVYIMGGFNPHKELMKKLGKYKVSGGSCLYINKLEDLDRKVLKELVTASVKIMKKQSK
jgi:hypothetical protein